MKRFFREFNQSLSLSHMPPLFREELGEFMRTQFEHCLKGSLKHTVHDKYDQRFDPSRLEDWSMNSIASELILPSVYKHVSLHDTMLSGLKKVYCSMYPNLSISENSLNRTVRMYSSLTYKGIRLNCNKKTVLFARVISTMQPRAVSLVHFISHSLHIPNGNAIEIREHVFASVSWLKEHHASVWQACGDWWKDIYEFTLDCYIPLQLLVCQSVYCDVKFELQTVYAVVPVHNICSIYKEQ